MEKASKPKAIINMKLKICTITQVILRIDQQGILDYWWNNAKKTFCPSDIGDFEQKFKFWKENQSNKDYSVFTFNMTF